MNTFQIKTYLFPENETVSFQTISKANEIRRFNLIKVDSSESLYKSLVEKIQATYVNILPNRDEIRTYYQDDENELIGFSTDSEMLYAIDLQKAISISKPYATSGSSAASANVFKVYIAKTVGGGSCSGGGGAGVDAGNCEARRFHWKQNWKHHHPGHGGSANEDEQLHVGVVCDGCSGCISGVRHKCTVCLDYDLCSACEQKEVHKETGHAFTKITKPIRKCPYAGFRRFGQFGHCHRRRYHENASASASGASTNPLQEKLNEFLPFLSSSIPIVNDPEQLKNVGEYLKNFLDPFGIDVDYYVDNINKATASKNEKDAANANANAASAEKPKEESHKSNEASNLMNVDSEEFQAEEAKKPEDKSKSVPLTPIRISATPLASTNAEPSAPAHTDLIQLQTSSPYSSASEALKQVIEKNYSSTNENEQVVMPKSNTNINAQEVKSEESLRNETSEANGGFHFEDIEKEIRIIRAIEQLKAMGYSDDGGWLTRLATAKDGNINSVLDAISPVKN